MNRPITRAQKFARGESNQAALGGVLTQHFSVRASKAPESIAAVWAGGEISYRDLDESSNRFARRLARIGVKSGHVVSLLCNRSYATLIAMLALLKLGAAYAPLDPSYPDELLDRMLSDCGASIAITTSAGARQLSAPSHDLKQLMAQSQNEEGSALDNASTPESVACVMYTSGSTGRPKGVLVPHRAIVRLVSGQTYADFGPAETWLHAAPLAFDASTLEIWGALLHGGRIAIVTEEKPSLADIGRAIEVFRPTAAWFTSGLFNLLVEHSVSALAPLRQIIAGGEVVSPTHMAAAQKALPHCRFVNGYGPTENTTFTCCYKLPEGVWQGGAIPIGHPIQHTYVRILDERLAEAPEGAVGELYAGGEGLALGYAGRSRSEPPFIADPFRPGALLYKTGDLVRLRSDGAGLDFMGRIDRQVKIDGKRVDLGEIEEALRCDVVEDALVAAINSSLGQHMLCAYLKTSAPAEAAVAAGRARAGRLLPAHMRPAHFVAVKDFPLSRNGKVDLSALSAAAAPSPAAARPASRDTFERSLGDIFARTLKRPSVSIDQNFFDLGATSLNLLAAHAMIEDAHGALDFVALFEHTTIRKLARHMQASASASGPSG